MPKRDWLGNAASLAIPFAAILCVLAIGYGLVLESYSERRVMHAEYQERADEYQEKAQQSIADACVGVLGAAFSICIEQQIKAYEANKPTDEDLRAQQQMALWALWMFIAACATVLVTVTGIYYLRETLDATRETLAEAGRTTKAAETQVTQAALVAKLELRAYISVNPGGINQLIGRTDMIGQAIVENVGATPARDVNIRVKMIFLKDKTAPLDAFDFANMSRYPVSRVIQPRSIARQGSEETPAIEETFPIKEGFLYVYGVVYYTDVYKEARYTRFCHRYDINSRNDPDAKHVRMRETKVLIAPDKARYHEYGNDAD